MRIILKDRRVRKASSIRTRSSPPARSPNSEEESDEQEQEVPGGTGELIFFFLKYIRVVLVNVRLRE